MTSRRNRLWNRCCMQCLTLMTWSIKQKNVSLVTNSNFTYFVFLSLHFTCINDHSRHRPQIIIIILTIVRLFSWTLDLVIHLNLVIPQHPMAIAMYRYLSRSTSNYEKSYSSRSKSTINKLYLFTVFCSKK